MKTGVVLLIGAVAVFGQVRGGQRTYGSPHGFGNILYPGVGTPPPVAGFGAHSTFAQRLGATISGFPPYTGAPTQQGVRGVRQGGLYGGQSYPVYVPYVYPVYGGGYGYGYQQAPNVTYVVQQQPAPAPQVIINQNFVPETVRPVLRDYTQTDLPESNLRTFEAPGRVPAADPSGHSAALQEKTTIYLIALSDGTIYAAVAWWVDGNTLNYVTLQGSHNRVTLDLVDRELSLRINTERGVEFQLPSARPR